MNETLKSKQNADGGSMMRLVRVVWTDVAPETGMISGPFTLWLIGDRLFHNQDGKPSYFCGFKQNASISDANSKADRPQGGCFPASCSACSESPTNTKL